MPGKGEVNGRAIETRAIIPLPIDPLRPTQPKVIPDPSPTIPDPKQPVFPTEVTSFVAATSSTPVTLTEVVTITKIDRNLSAQSTVMPKKIATVTSIISDVSSAQGNNASTVNISGIILGILVGLVIVGGSIVILIRRKFSKNKENKKNQSRSTSMDGNVHNNVPNAELPEIISDDNQRLQRESLIYFHPQFPVPPPRPQIPSPQHSPQILQYSPQNPPIALYTGVNPNYYQKYSQLRPPNATDVTSSNSEQSQFSSNT